MATRVADNDLNSATAAFRASSSKLQNGHHMPRKKVTTSGPDSNSWLDDTSFPLESGSSNAGNVSPNLGIGREATVACRSPVDLRMIATASGVALPADFFLYSAIVSFNVITNSLFMIFPGAPKSNASVSRPRDKYTNPAGHAVHAVTKDFDGEIHRRMNSMTYRVGSKSPG